MGLLSSTSSGDDRLQVGIAVFCLVVSLMVTTMIPIMAPGYEPDYTEDDIISQKLMVQGFTGESMTNQTPWVLTGIYTPYVPGSPFGVTDEGWLYGNAFTEKGGGATQYIGESQNIKLDPTKKSSVPLDYSVINQDVTTDKVKWYWAERLGMPNLNLVGPQYSNDAFLEPSRGTNWLYEIAHFIDPSINPYEQVSYNLPSWNYSGYRYEFDPMLMINTSNPDQIITSDDAKLSIVWYDTYGQQGISGGLVLYNEKSKGIVANIPAADIIENYNTHSSFSSKYILDFNGIKINLNIRFDPDVITQGRNLSEAWNAGDWSLAFTATSAGNLMDLKNSNSLELSVGGIIDTYLDIFTFSIPDVPGYWSLILWIVCVFPVEIVMMMFLSRFGLAGVGMGILGNVLLGVLG